MNKFNTSTKNQTAGWMLFTNLAHELGHITNGIEKMVQVFCNPCEHKGSSSRFLGNLPVLSIRDKQGGIVSDCSYVLLVLSFSLDVDPIQKIQIQVSEGSLESSQISPF
jgi:hypothetical protein